MWDWDKDHDSSFSSFSSGITHFSPAHLLQLSSLVLLLYYLILHFLHSTVRDSPANPSRQYLILCYKWDWWASGIPVNYITAEVGEGKAPQNVHHREVQCNSIQTSTEHFLSSVQGIGNHIEHPRNKKCIFGIKKTDKMRLKGLKTTENNRNSRKTLLCFSLNNDVIIKHTRTDCCVQKIKVDMNFPIYTIFSK